MLQTLIVVTSTAAVALVLSLVFALAIACSNGKQKGDNQTKARVFVTFRISNIPKGVTKEQFRDILDSLSDEIITGPDTALTNYLGWSFAPAAASALSERFCVATTTFHIPPALDEVEAAIKRNIGVKAGRLRVDLDFFGLTPLADPQDDVAVE